MDDKEKMDLNLESYGFKPIACPSDSIPNCIHLSKRRTINTNRAICVLRLTELPDEMETYLKSVRNKVAFKIGFFPVLYCLGLQIVVICPGATSLKGQISNFVAKVDNQWAIIQSVFLADPEKGEFIEKRTWGQVLTGKFQDEISRQLKAIYRSADA